MKFSYKFLISNLLILVIFVFANVLALKHYASANFVTYLEDIKKDSADVDIAFIDSIIENKKLDPELIKEYMDITKDLWKMTDNLETYSNNPKPTNNEWLLESLQKSWMSSNTIEQIIWTNALQSFFWNILNLFELDSSNPEWKFILTTLKQTAFFNLVLIAIILILSYFWINYSFRPIRDIVDNLSNIIHKKKYRNIIYMKKDEFHPLFEVINNLNKSLSIQEKIRSDFLSDLSHEIKTPITAIKCYLEWIEDGIIKIDENNMKILYEEIERLIKITNSIMDYEKEESKNFGDIFIEKLDLSKLIEKVMEEYSPQLIKTNQQIISYIPHKFNINADKDKMMQLLHNIFSNFKKYAWNKTTLIIKAYNKVNSINIIFTDNWKWIKEDEIPFVKEKFYKSDKTRNKHNDSWVGIWLSVVEKIVKLHNGELHIKSWVKKWFEIKINLPN